MASFQIALAEAVHPISRAQRGFFQGTLSLLEGVDNFLNPLVICNNDHRFLVAEQYRQLGMEGSKILLEPAGKNTAPGVALTAIYAQQR